MHESHYNFKSQKQPVFLAPEKSAFCLACAYTGAVKASFDKSDVLCSQEGMCSASNLGLKSSKNTEGCRV